MKIIRGLGVGVGFIGRGMGALGRGTIALVGICGVVAALANYTMTQGTGTTFGSIVVSTVHYAQGLVCDFTTPSQCVNIKAASTAPVATDLAMVVTESPNSPLITGASTVLAGTAPSTQTAATSGTVTKLQSDLNGNLYANIISQYPAGAVPITASATGTTTATTATLAASTSIKTYICGYSIRANATTTTNVTDTVTGVVSGTMSSALWVPANTAGLGVDEQIFSPCIPSSAINTAVAVVSGAPGSGGVVTVKAWGYQQ